MNNYSKLSYEELDSMADETIDWILGSPKNPLLPEAWKNLFAILLAKNELRPNKKLEAEFELLKKSMNAV